MRRFALIILVVALTACTTPVPLPTPIAPAATSTSRPSTITVKEPLDYRAAMKPEFAADIDRFEAAPHYQIDLTIAPDLKSYSATQIVTYTNAETVTLHEVYFSLFANLDSYGGQVQLKTVHVNGQDVPPILEEGNSAVKLDLAQPLAPGRSIEIAMTYTGAVPTSDVERGYNQFGWHDNVLALPNFYPQIPVYDQRGWNIARGPGYGDAVFSDTALYRVTITAPTDQVVAASGTCEATPEGATQVVQCVSGPMRDFMIVMSADYAVKSNAVDGVKVTSYYLKEDVEAGARALQVVSDALKSYDRRIGPYPFSELDLVETPTSAGGIEYPGLIVVAASLYQKQSNFFEGATAHETAHQWWYSLVGDDQIHDPWLDEAFAQFTTGLYYRDTYGVSSMQGYVEQALVELYGIVKNTDRDKRADLPVSDYSESQYTAIVYGKAPLFFNAVYEALGDAKFDQFMQEYFQTYRYGVAYPKDLLAIAAKYVGQAKLDELAKKWIETP